jgi:DeoR/GlpR family transcriptional regulator of sugar metabolism
MTVCSWKDVDIFITDSITAEERAVIEKNSVKIIV